ncbi:hypothetical protein FF38_10505 [Lucilia cuprina]|uniref:Uncharacterized protein n=1 Tax=Lucilia cuprina TaxID=7375 RepID=A0A0L0CE09_LUCCU|nr:hypothetical protein FF38_10505 [Lucilia cuprina]
MNSNLIPILSNVIVRSTIKGNMCQHMANVTKQSYVKNNPDDKFPRFCGILHEIAAIRAGKSTPSNDGSICGICPMGVKILSYLLLNNGITEEDCLLMNIDMMHCQSGVSDMCLSFKNNASDAHFQLWCNQSVYLKSIKSSYNEEIECHNCPFFTPNIQTEVLTDDAIGINQLLREPIANIFKEEGVVIYEDQSSFNYKRYWFSLYENLVYTWFILLEDIMNERLIDILGSYFEFLENIRVNTTWAVRRTLSDELQTYYEKRSRRISYLCRSIDKLTTSSRNCDVVRCNNCLFNHYYASQDNKPRYLNTVNNHIKQAQSMLIPCSVEESSDE